MREILFRGKRVDNGEWVEGIAFLHDGDKVTMFRQHPMDGSLEGKEVIPETVGQYTGLTDKNGKRIFEGDIVEHERHMHIVAYNDEYAGFCPFYDQDHPAGYGVIGEESEIIGNIHDNPELLEGGIT